MLPKKKFEAEGRSIVELLGESVGEKRAQKN